MYPKISSIFLLGSQFFQVDQIESQETRSAIMATFRKKTPPVRWCSDVFVTNKTIVAIVFLFAFESGH
jgi:hypothetical protein